MAQSASNSTDEPLPTDDEDNPDYKTALAKMGLSEGDAYRVDGDIYLFVALKRAGGPYAEILELTAGGRNYRREARVDNLWCAFRDGDLDVGTAEVTFKPAADDTQSGGD